VIVINSLSLCSGSSSRRKSSREFLPHERWGGGVVFFCRTKKIISINIHNFHNFHKYP
jgi:hypothetical protein